MKKNVSAMSLHQKSQGSELRSFNSLRYAISLNHAIQSNLLSKVLTCMGATAKNSDLFTSCFWLEKSPWRRQTYTSQGKSISQNCKSLQAQSMRHVTSHMNRVEHPTLQALMKCVLTRLTGLLNGAAIIHSVCLGLHNEQSLLRCVFQQKLSS